MHAQVPPAPHLAGVHLALGFALGIVLCIVPIIALGTVLGIALGIVSGRQDCVHIAHELDILYCTWHRGTIVSTPVAMHVSLI